MKTRGEYQIEAAGVYTQKADKIIEATQQLNDLDPDERLALLASAQVNATLAVAAATAALWREPLRDGGLGG